jgi:hypothetical protein
MNILVLGGTRFMGKHLVSTLLRKGHKITIATRGMAENVCKKPEKHFFSPNPVSPRRTTEKHPILLIRSLRIRSDFLLPPCTNGYGHSSTTI